MPRSDWKTTWVAVADGCKALILVNEGTDADPLLRVVSKSELDNPPSRALGTDRAGRMPGPMARQRSAVETTDWHAFEEARFVREFAKRLDHAGQREKFDRLILVAPPRVLGELRAALPAHVRARLVTEVASDLTKHPVSEIEMRIAKRSGS